MYQKRRERERGKEKGKRVSKSSSRPIFFYRIKHSRPLGPSALERMLSSSRQKILFFSRPTGSGHRNGEGNSSWFVIAEPLCRVFVFLHTASTSVALIKLTLTVVSSSSPSSSFNCFSSSHYTSSRVLCEINGTLVTTKPSPNLFTAGQHIGKHSILVNTIKAAI